MGSIPPLDVWSEIREAKDGFVHDIEVGSRRWKSKRPCHEHNLKQNLIHYIYHKNKKNKPCETQDQPI